MDNLGICVNRDYLLLTSVGILMNQYNWVNTTEKYLPDSLGSFWLWYIHSIMLFLSFSTESSEFNISKPERAKNATVILQNKIITLSEVKQKHLWWSD